LLIFFKWFNFFKKKKKLSYIKNKSNFWVFLGFELFVYVFVLKKKEKEKENVIKQKNIGSSAKTF
jgi:hypothetical protein